jgi:sulfite reductase subunit B
MEKFFEITLKDGRPLDFEPGQFVVVTLPGIGEAPISICSSPTKRRSFDLVVRRVGSVTDALHKLEAGDKIGIRGPFGKGFPLLKLEGNDLLIIGGGLGLVPLRSMIHFVLDNRRNYGSVTILLGCKTPKDLLFADELQTWSKRVDVNLSCTVDRGGPEWKGHLGLITSLIPKISIDPERIYALVVGPPVMYKFVIIELKKKNIPEERIYLSLERQMRCGLGKCGHCQIGVLYCCQDGPVFSLAALKNNHEAL